MSPRARHILVVDDEPDVRFYLSTILKQQGDVVVDASSVDEAWRIIGTERPDLVCLDIMMPEESGISLYQQIRQHPELKGIPVLIISGVVQAGDFDFRTFVSDESIPEPDAYLEKPIVIDQFLATVDRLTARTSKSGSGPGV